MKKDNSDFELILLDKGPIQSLKNEELPIVSKHKILVPDIFLIENLKRKETLNKLSQLKNTYWVKHWGLLAKESLLGQLDRTVTVIQEDLTEITDDPKKLKKETELAKKVAKDYDDWPRQLLQKRTDLSAKGNMKRIMKRVVFEVKRLYPHIKITDDLIKTTETALKKKESIFTIRHEEWEKLAQIVVDDLDNKPIREENRYIREEQRNYIRDKEWLDFACLFFQTTSEEKTQIFNRWKEKFHHSLKYFAPYAYYILVLEMTIALHITKSQGSYKREIMRDFRYLYYANFSNVTFHTSDRKLKDTIHKIPFLRHIQKKMVYFNNDEVNRPGEFNKSDWLKKLGNSHSE